MEASNPDKIMFPGDGGRPDLTKADLVGYYTRIAPRMLPMVQGRPLTLHRFPNGIGGKGFMQKNAAKHFPSSIGRYEVPKQEGGTTVYPVVDQAEDIAWLANQGTIVFHIWTNRVDGDARGGGGTGGEPAPDWMVLDLDPADGSASRDGDGRPVATVHAAAAATREVLDGFGIESFPVATGSKGFHLWIALDGAHDHDAVATANRALAGLVAARNPDVATTEFLKRNRGGRVFIDWLRANRRATVVAPLSLRARPGAPVAAPVGWDEVAESAPDRWTIADVDQLLARPTLDELVTEQRPLPVDAITSAARDEGVDLDTPFDRFGRTR